MLEHSDSERLGVTSDSVDGNLVRQSKTKKDDLARAVEINGYAMQRLNHDEPVQMEVMIRLCKVFHCDIGDLMEVIEEDEATVFIK